MPAACNYFTVKGSAGSAGNPPLAISDWLKFSFRARVNRSLISVVVSTLFLMASKD
jgi:hypothetical protein